MSGCAVSFTRDFSLRGRELWALGRPLRGHGRCTGLEKDQGSPGKDVLKKSLLFPLGWSWDFRKTSPLFERDSELHVFRFSL